ncbi:MAG: hypothetical protein ACKPKO_37445, partial [Candidatus Fonsibacter sp.]
MLDHEIIDELRARVTERQHNDAANDRQRITVAQRKQRRLAMMDQQAPWSKFKKASVDIENRVYGDFPVVGRLAQADICVVSYLRKDKLRDSFRWRTALAGCWLLSNTAAMGEQGVLVEYKLALHSVARYHRHGSNNL